MSIVSVKLALTDGELASYVELRNIVNNFILQIIIMLVARAGRRPLAALLVFA